MSASLAEGVASRIVYKFSASGLMTSNALAVMSVDPGASGGQVLRRVSSDMELVKGSFTSAEVRTDRQVYDLRHTSRRVQGGITGELSPGTYAEFFQALTRGTMGTANTTLLPATYTSVAADNTLSTFTFAGGDPVVTGGIRVGSIISFAGLSPTTNNGINYLVTSVSGASNRTIGVFPAPATHVASVTFTCTLVGRRLFVPNSGHVSRKVLFENYYEDLDISRMFKECRIGSASVQLQPDQASSVSFGVVGRDLEILTAGAAPFFTAPTAETATPVVASVGGVILAGGTVLGVMTGLNFSIDLSPDAPPVIGQNFTPNVFLGKFMLTGTLTAFFENVTLLNYFLNETEFAILGLFKGSQAVNAPSMSFFMPRVKASAAQLPMQGDTGQVITIPFTALRADAAAGIEPTTLQIVDTAAV